MDCSLQKLRIAVLRSSVIQNYERAASMLKFEPGLATREQTGVSEHLESRSFPCSLLDACL